MSDKLLIDRKLLERLQERLDPHIDARDWGMLCDAFRAQQSSQGGEAVEVPRVLGLDHPHCPRNPLIADGFRCGADWMRRQVLALGPLYTRPATPTDSRVVPVELLEQVLGCIDAMGWDDLEADIRTLLKVKP